LRNQYPVKQNEQTLDLIFQQAFSLYRDWSPATL